MWVDKHAPHCISDLAVHKKKIEEVQQWLQQANVSLELGLPPASRLLVLSGPPGAGKSATLRVLACAPPDAPSPAMPARPLLCQRRRVLSPRPHPHRSEMRFELCEWAECVPHISTCPALVVCGMLPLSQSSASRARMQRWVAPEDRHYSRDGEAP